MVVVKPLYKLNELVASVENILSAIKADISQLSVSHFSSFLLHFPVYTRSGKRNKNSGYVGKCPSIHVNSLY